jgi:hypothetical protein
MRAGSRWASSRNVADQVKAMGAAGAIVASRPATAAFQEHMPRPSDPPSKLGDGLSQSPEMTLIRIACTGSMDAETAKNLAHVGNLSNHLRDRICYSRAACLGIGLGPT